MIGSRLPENESRYFPHPTPEKEIVKPDTFCKKEDDGAVILRCDGDSRTHRLYQLNRNSLDLDRSTEHKSGHRWILS